MSLPTVVVVIEKAQPGPICFREILFAEGAAVMLEAKYRPEQ